MFSGEHELGRSGQIFWFGKFRLEATISLYRLDCKNIVFVFLLPRKFTEWYEIYVKRCSKRCSIVYRFQITLMVVLAVS